MNHSKTYGNDPDTPLNIPKTAKKSFVNWIVPVFCAAVLMGVFTVVKSWADDRYAIKSVVDSNFLASSQALTDEQKRREGLGLQIDDINRKLDLLIYISQHDGKLTPNEMKGKLSPPELF